MLSFLPSPLLLVINVVLIICNTIVIATPIMLLALIRLVLPLNSVKIGIDRLNQILYDLWVHGNSLTLALTNKIEWRISGDTPDELRRSCIIISNHLSCTDIVLVCQFYRGRIPFTKYFLKHSLLYIPFIGQACLALGMPFMRRYSKQELIKNPALLQKDIQTTKTACRRLSFPPSSLVNFVEGTRFTPEKAALAKSPYQHLMPPKPAALAVTLGEIGPQLQCILNTTLLYPDNPEKPFIDLLKGRLRTVIAHIEILPITADLCGDYSNDKPFKRSFTLKLRALWQQKDELICRLLEELRQERAAQQQ